MINHEAERPADQMEVRGPASAYILGLLIGSGTYVPPHESAFVRPAFFGQFHLEDPEVAKAFGRGIMTGAVTHALSDKSE